ncbi:hypothetical protein TcCL_Unassigned02974 [Trypanosoma cruzi]|nr:hypothetical protein TcCL_Unassigned02974 [Trypanosoma cruzi]
MPATAAPSNPPPPTNLHRQRTAPPISHSIFQIARRNRREGQWSLSVNDARLWHDGTPTSPLWASYMRRANEVAREMWAPSTWEQRMSLAGQFTTFCCTHEQPMNEESCAAFLMAIDVAPSTRLQYARMLRSKLEMDGTPLDMVILGLKKFAVRSEKKKTRQARPATEEGMNQVIRSRTDWKERVVLRPAWITASRLFEIAALIPNNFKLKPDGALILDWSVAPKTARADPHRALRFVRIREQDAFHTINLCRTLHENEKLTNITNAQVERALAPLECHGAFHRTRCVAARCSNRGEVQFEFTRDLAVGEARQSVRPSPEYCSIFWEVHHSADPGIVAGRIDVRETLRKGRSPG